jgi:pimeloyl-ACP methyl ester carboxylesterase
MDRDAHFERKHMPESSSGTMLDPESIEIVEPVPGSRYPAHLIYVETWDGLYAPIGLRLPSGNGPFPVVLLASGNGGGGMTWIREAIRNQGHIMERLLDAGFACTWIRYRTEVELGYNLGGELVRDMRQGRELFNRSPLEYEDEIAIIEHLKSRPDIDGDRVGLIGMSHGGEMALKIASEYHGVAAAVASEPAAHEFLALDPDDTVSVDDSTGLRNIENMQMSEVEKVLDRIDNGIAMGRIATIDTPMLVMGRETDHLQGIFRATYELMEKAGKDVEWVSYDHPLHGYVFPLSGPDGEPEVDDTQEEAIDHVISYLKRHLG